MSMNRRQLLGAGEHTATFHIASLVVQCRSENVSRVAAEIEDMSGAEVPARDERGKMVVLLESDGESHLLQAITHIEHMPGVISANLVFHQIDE